MTSTDHQLADIYRQASHPLRQRIAPQVRGDVALLEDVLQETWWRAIRTWPTTGIPLSPLAWLTTVAQNILRNSYRSRVRSQIVSGGLVDASTSETSAVSADEQLIAQEELRALRRALDQLPVIYREVVQAFYFDGQSIAAIAAATRQSNRAIEGRLRRARFKLRAMLVSEAPRPQPYSNRHATAGWLAAALSPIAAIFAFATLLRLIRQLSPGQLAIYRIAAGVLFIAMSLVMKDSMIRPQNAPWILGIGAMLVIWGCGMHWKRRL